MGTFKAQYRSTRVLRYWAEMRIEIPRHCRSEGLPMTRAHQDVRWRAGNVYAASRRSFASRRGDSAMTSGRVS